MQPASSLMHYLATNIKLSLVSYGHCPWFRSCHRREAAPCTHAGSWHRETASDWKTESGRFHWYKLVINNSVSMLRVYGHVGHYRATEIIRNRVWGPSSASFFICGISPVVCFVRSELVRIIASVGHGFDTRFLVGPVWPLLCVEFFSYEHDTRHCLGWCRNPVNFVA